MLRRSPNALPGRPTVRGDRGFTVVELLVVLAIAAALMAMSFSTFSSLRHAKLRAEAMRLSGALRMVYGRSAVNGIRYQVTIDLDSASYRVDCSEDNVLLDDESETTGFSSDDDEADPFGLGAQLPTLSDCSEPLLESTTLRGDVRFARMVTTHHDDPVEEGAQTIAYFPNGFVERTLIWLQQGEDNFLTLAIDPMTGRVNIYPGEIEVPEDFFEVEEDR